MKKLLFTIIPIISILLIGGYQYRKIQALPQNSTELVTSFGTFNFDSSKTNEMQVSLSEIESKFNFINEKYNIPKKSVNVNYHHKLGKKSPIGNNRSYYDGITNTISYYESSQFSIPIIHEYIHSQIGYFSEKWFNEGITVLLHLKAITSDKNLKRSNTLDEKIYERFSCGDKRILCTEKIGEELSKSKITSLLKNKVKLNTREKNIQFYAVSAAFCEYLIEQVGLEDLLSVIGERNWHEKSIKNLLKKNQIEIDILMEKWISDTFKD